MRVEVSCFSQLPQHALELLIAVVAAEITRGLLELLSLRGRFLWRLP